MIAYPEFVRVKPPCSASYGSVGPAGRSGLVAVEEIERLRAELRDSAAGLDRHGRHDAADLAVMLAARLGELIEAHGRESEAAGRMGS